MATELSSAKTTLTGTRINPLPGDVPFITTSLCPECGLKVEATVLERDGKIYMEKTCSQHGFFSDVVLSDAYYYHRMMAWNRDVGRGVSNQIGRAHV